MGAYYNEIDPFCVEWLGNLANAGRIAAGRVDGRDIRTVRPEDLAGATQCHFFAGIGVWSYALRLAGWSDDLAVWTGSAPCQPWSAAGRRSGATDERHLWPDWFDLIRQCRPDVIFGEQVSSPDGLKWFDLVCADLEGEGYAVGALDTCAAGVGAPHIRQRLYFVALSGLGYANSEHARRIRGTTSRAETACTDAWEINRAIGDLTRTSSSIDRTDIEWLACRDGKRRPAKSGTFPLAYGTPARVGKLRAYGNAIVAPQAAAFIRAVMDVLGI